MISKVLGRQSKISWLLCERHVPSYLSKSSSKLESTELASKRAAASFTLVETIPDGMKFKDGTSNLATYTAWLDLVANAKFSIDIASFYWTLTEGAKWNNPTGDKGQRIFDELVDAGTGKKVRIRIAQNLPSLELPSTDSQVLLDREAAQVRNLNFERLITPKAALASKFLLVDRKRVYIGSANMDWRSLTEVKELGVLIDNCPEIAEDVRKLFEMYWEMGESRSTIPERWLVHFDTDYNKEAPLDLASNGKVYISSSPPAFCSETRTGCPDAITSLISNARKFIYVENYEYVPLYASKKKQKYWGVLDRALRAAAVDNSVDVRLLISIWPHSNKETKAYLKSLLCIKSPNIKLSVKLFEVPVDDQKKLIAYGRVNHNKFMVTDNSAYIGTASWTGEGFNLRGGLGIAVQGDTSLRKQLQQVFLRDWNSEFAKDFK